MLPEVSRGSYTPAPARTTYEICADLMSFWGGGGRVDERLFTEDAQRLFTEDAVHVHDAQLQIANCASNRPE